MKDLYAILGVAKDASHADIKKAYRHLAMKLHPDKHPPNRKKHVEESFKQINEAYSTLSNQEQRRLYDLNEKQGKQEFNAVEAFERFFQDDNPFQHVNFHETTPFHGQEEKDSATGSKTSTTAPEAKKSKMDDVVIDLPYTLDDIYYRRQKVLKVTRKRLSSEKKLYDETKSITVRANKSWQDGVELRFENEGDESIDQSPGNLVFRLKESKHKCYQRHGIDLIYIAKISLLDALLQCTLSIPTIDGKTITVSFPEVIHSHYERRIGGEGLSFGGDLIIRFEIQFPLSLTDRARLELKHVLN